jgi:predicted DNA-binding transcriptional regulator YafY
VIALVSGLTRVRLQVGGEAWLARLLLRLGPHAAVVEGDGSAAVGAAARILGRYRRQPGPGGSGQPVASSGT